MERQMLFRMISTEEMNMRPPQIFMYRLALAMEDGSSFMITRKVSEKK